MLQELYQVWRHLTDFVFLSISDGNRNQAEYVTDSSIVICGECMSVYSQ